MSDMVILTQDAPWRGCSSKFPQPISSKDKDEAQKLTDVIRNTNYTNIVYRSSEKDIDIGRHVFRWDLAPYREVFKDGLQVRRPHFSPDQTFYSLETYVEGNQMRPLDSRKESSMSFISTTVSNSWYPPIPSDRGRPRTLKVYRYEIYAPGGIWVAASLGSKHPKKVKRHDEVVFVGGIAPQYIRSVQAFSLTGTPDGSTILDRQDNMLLINGGFNPQSHPLNFLKIENPVCDYTGAAVPLVQRITNKSAETSNPNIIKWYTTDVTNRNLYMSSSFRSSLLNEAYYILQNVVVQLYYDPGGSHDRVVKGPLFISQMFRSLEYTPFGEHGIDAAFQLQGDEAMIFNSNLCARINYAPGTRNDKILKGPMTIPEMIPLLKGTVFENGLDSAFESKLDNEYFLCKGNVCAQIKYDAEADEFEFIKIGQLAQIIPILKNTIYEDGGIDAAYGSHAHDETAYLFQVRNFSQLNIDLKENKDVFDGPYIMGSVAGVIATFAPRKNRGLDMREDAGALPINQDDYDHDHVVDVEPTNPPPHNQPSDRPSNPPYDASPSNPPKNPSHDRPSRPPHGRPWGRPSRSPSSSPSCSPPPCGPQWGPSGPHRSPSSSPSCSPPPCGPQWGPSGPHRSPSSSPPCSPPPCGPQWGPSGPYHSPPRHGRPHRGSRRSPSCSPPRSPSCSPPRGSRWW